MLMFTNYLPIKNTTICENITFGAEFDQDRYNSAIRASCLQPDLDAFPAGDRTIVGEKGIQLSGGQKQRISIARALYSNADVLLFDDIFSALDARVGRQVFERALLGRSGNTRLLVTHALHFLSKVDYIYAMEEGRIVERGTYEELIKGEGTFAQMMRDFAPKEEKEIEQDSGEIVEDGEKKPFAKASELMQAEERAVGGVSPHGQRAPLDSRRSANSFGMG